MTLLNEIKTIISSLPLEKSLVEPDQVYHRTVISLVGDLRVIFQALDLMTPLILEAVDLNTHQGTHYRMGAIDVIPFVFEKADEHHIDQVKKWATTFSKHSPVYFYGALNPKRLSVGSIRKGGLESLLKRIEKGFSHPDLGGFPTLKSGVTAIGVRPPLGAFNIRVPWHDGLKEMVVRMRDKDHGLPGLMSAIFPVNEGVVDLSFNLTQLDKTSLKDVYDRCVHDLKAFGLIPLESTLVGLISRDDVFKGFNHNSIKAVEAYFNVTHSLNEKVIDWSFS